jgi:rubrerythrin
VKAAALLSSVLLVLLPTAPLAIAEEVCMCADARLVNGWCEAHEVGYVAGLEIRSAELFETLDTHGHVIAPEFIRCAKCLEARQTDGFCEEHRMGFVEGLAYLSPLTYHLAKGEVKDLSRIACPICKKNAESYGWCPKCNVGMVGHVEIRDPASFKELLRAYDTLLSARETVARCELCASAMVVDGRCPVCKIAYKDGQPIEAPK